MQTSHVSLGLDAKRLLMVSVFTYGVLRFPGADPGGGPGGPGPPPDPRF